jgi:peptide-methionine (R)-S-oxide reductase
MKQLFLLLATGITLICCSSSAEKSEVPNTKLETNHSQMSKDSTNPYYSRTDTNKLNLTNEQWKAVLPDSIYHIAREKGTEYPFSGKYWNYTGLGFYYCAACGNKLFKSDSKFGSSCGWPSFFETIRKDAVIYNEDRTHGMIRVEVVCGRCEGHLGHIFDDGPKPTGKRYCMNSLMLDFEPEK